MAINRLDPILGERAPHEETRRPRVIPLRVEFDPPIEARIHSPGNATHGLACRVLGERDFGHGVSDLLVEARVGAWDRRFGVSRDELVGAIP